ncbi:hypothetical protein GJAV_G00048070 [Gymnothorax javanicus]|nr:hypothetical protein GJAV_G00048070 [Gymnothorax javanicus]
MANKVQCGCASSGVRGSFTLPKPWTSEHEAAAPRRAREKVCRTTPRSHQTPTCASTPSLSRCADCRGETCSFPHYLSDRRSSRWTGSAGPTRSTPLAPRAWPCAGCPSSPSPPAEIILLSPEQPCRVTEADYHASTLKVHQACVTEVGQVQNETR